ncbi:MAG: gamma-glutamyltransferase [Alphaproteobacteria bacterium]|nr:gamma-glutamyltransferase [Alphaproteobacteria bacterium]
MPIQNWIVRKPVAASRGGVIASQNGTAAKVGADILAAGGSAVDAVVAAAFALSVREPWNSGLGGIGFMVVHPPGGGRAEVIDFGPMSPAGLNPADYALTGETATELFTWPRVVDDRNMHGPASFAVPSAVRGYATAIERFGRLPWRDLVAPAVELARHGLPVDWWVTVKTANSAADLRLYDESRRVWLPNDLPPAVPPGGGARPLALGRLGDTLARLAEYGPDDFYQGEIARAIAADARDGGGCLSAEDLARCRARIVPSLEIPYRDYSLHAARGLSAAPTLADVIDRMSSRRFGSAPDATYFETLIGALQQAYHTRLEGLGDTSPPGESCTTHITAIDRDGGIAALTTTLLSSFGSRYVLPQTGILMNNGIMWFDPRPGQPNSIGAGKRALTNMCPVVGARDGRARFGVGASGGRRILAAVVQLASFIVDFAMSAGEAAHYPRIDVSGETGISIDTRLSEAIRDRLMSRAGAALTEHTAWPAMFACPNLVVRGEDGLNYGVSDVMSPSSAAVAETGKEA